VTYLRGGSGGLSQVGEIEAGNVPVALTSGDFDGDGLLDVVVANADSNDVSYLSRQIYRTPHSNSFIDVEKTTDPLIDTRNPAQYLLT
jgi:hypothetical protein